MAREIEFQDLPESIVLRIFSFTSERRIFNLFRLRRVCKRWLRLSEDLSLWRKIAFPNCDNLCYEVLKRVFLGVEMLGMLTFQTVVGWMINVLNLLPINVPI